MASVYHLCSDAQHIKETIVNKYSQHAGINKKRYFSAVAIQRTWRGYSVRKMIKRWNAAATTIQRWVRGWLVRWHLPQLYKEHYEFLSCKFYHKEATKIQALWRGYWTRKCVGLLDLLAYKKHLEKVTNNMMMKLRDAFAKFNAPEDENSLEYQVKAMQNVLSSIFDRHHLLRTYQLEGVLSIHGSHELSNLEKCLKSLQFKDYMKKLHGLFDPPQLPQKGRERFDLKTKLDPKPYQRLLLYED